MTITKTGHDSKQSEWTGFHVSIWSSFILLCTYLYQLFFSPKPVVMVRHLSCGPADINQQSASIGTRRPRLLRRCRFKGVASHPSQSAKCGEAEQSCCSISCSWLLYLIYNWFLFIWISLSRCCWLLLKLERKTVVFVLLFFYDCRRFELFCSTRDWRAQTTLVFSVKSSVNNQAAALPPPPPPPPSQPADGKFSVTGIRDSRCGSWWMSRRLLLPYIHILAT